MKTKTFLLCACVGLLGCGVEGVVGTDDDMELLDPSALEDEGLEEISQADESLLAMPQEDLTAEEGLALQATSAGTREMAATAYQCRNVCGNCVYYARCRQPKLPSGLYTYRDKVRIINNWHNPHHGCVAVIKTSHVYGHVAFVRYVEGSRIYIAEANWARSCPTTRSGTQGGLNITGFFCPR